MRSRRWSGPSFVMNLFLKLNKAASFLSKKIKQLRLVFFQAVEVDEEPHDLSGRYEVVQLPWRRGPLNGGPVSKWVRGWRSVWLRTPATDNMRKSDLLIRTSSNSSVHQNLFQSISWIHGWGNMSSSGHQRELLARTLYLLHAYGA
jgi:hypothetical protein